MSKISIEKSLFFIVIFQSNFKRHNILKVHSLHNQMRNKDSRGSKTDFLFIYNILRQHFFTYQILFYLKQIKKKL